MTKNYASVPKAFNPTITDPGYLIRKNLLRSISQFAPQLNGSLMDFGCGSKPYQSLLKVDKYTGVDFAGEGHSHENENIDVYYNGLTLPFSPNTFDSILTSEVFEHVFNLEQILLELNRVLKPEGKILITCPFALCEHETPNDFARYTSYGLKDLLTRSGFEVIEFKKAGSAVETIGLNFINYFYFDVIRGVFGKVPVLRTVLKMVSIPVFNLLTILLSKIMPKGKDFYMSNVVLATKK